MQLARRSLSQRWLTVRWKDINHHQITLLTPFKQTELLLPIDARPTEDVELRDHETGLAAGLCHKQRVRSYTAGLVGMAQIRPSFELSD